jgi:hypothetical protein
MIAVENWLWFVAVAEISTGAGLDEEIRFGRRLPWIWAGIFTVMLMTL